MGDTLFYFVLFAILFFFASLVAASIGLGIFITKRYQTTRHQTPPIQPPPVQTHRSPPRS